jgi:hypothetical protein
MALPDSSWVVMKRLGWESFPWRAMLGGLGWGVGKGELMELWGFADLLRNLDQDLSEQPVILLSSVFTNTTHRLSTY